MGQELNYFQTDIRSFDLFDMEVSSAKGTSYDRHIRIIIEQFKVNFKSKVNLILN